MTNTNTEANIEIMTGTPNGDVVEYGDEDAETVEAAVGSDWRVDWETPAYKLANGRRRSPVFKQATVTFGCSDSDLGYEAWQAVFADLAAHLEATIGEDLYSDAWTPADEGAQRTCDAGRIDEIARAIIAFDGPVEVYGNELDEDTITIEQIRKLRNEATASGDSMQVDYCDLALATHETADANGGDLIDPQTKLPITRTEARGICADAINAARAADS